MIDRLNLAVLVDAGARFAGFDETLRRLLQVLHEADVAPGIVGVAESPLERWRIDERTPADPPAANGPCYQPEAIAVPVQLQPSLTSRARLELVDQTQTLILPYAHDLSDRSQGRPQGWTPDEWLQYLMDGFDRLDQEAQEAADARDGPTMLILLLHPQFSGRAGAVQALQQFLRCVDERVGIGWRSPLQLAAEVRACL